MGTKKQDREKARKRQEALDAKHAAKEAVRQRNIRIASIVVGIVALGLIIWGAIVLFTPEDEEATADTGSSPSTSETADAEASPDAELTFTSGWGTSPVPPDPSYAQGREWTVTMETNQGEIVMTLDGVNAPQATASFIALAESDFFDHSQCHRITTSGIYVLQCGDPSATGTGGPNYSYGPIENAPEDDLYPAGTLAMARVGGDAESMGSQFFIVYEDSTIPSDTAGGYTVFGQVTAGLSIVEDVASAGTITGESDGPPAQSVIVNEVSVE
ncbi:peptidylprolyl isomerase [Demequina flava]|uniref:peptidylprolyl isomerase n=1 Tax=Demequina flava TaxID=1095025 RepID=UPI0007824637|nr:peptidylprolyl isomerase [Demequina flava]